MFGKVERKKRRKRRRKNKTRHSYMRDTQATISFPSEQVGTRCDSDLFVYAKPG